MSENHNTEPFAIVLDGKGGIKANLDINDVTKDTKYLWLHLDYKKDITKNILKKLNIDSYIADALCSPNIRQKFYQNDNKSGTFIVLRGMNSQNINKYGDMTSLRIWIDNDIIITLCHNYSPSVAITLDKLKNNLGPKNNVECFTTITQTSFHSISDITYKILEKVDRFEEKIIKNKDKLKFNNKLAYLRRQIITIHRYLLPQKEIFKNLPNSSTIFSDAKYKNQFRDLYIDISKSIENLEYSREHIVILKEELENSVNISINNNMYILSLVIAIFTPLTLISGILGMNLKGIPFSDNPYSFSIVCGIMLIIALILFFIVKHKKLV